jgi:hypothetical protein
VADVYSAARRVKEMGCEMLWNTRHKIVGVDRFFTRDPDGNRVEIQGSDAEPSPV